MELFNLQIPIRHEGRLTMATLQIPRVMEPGEYDGMREAIRWNLDHFRDALTHDPSRSEAEMEGRPQS